MEKCKECGSTEVARCKWVNPNTNYIYDADSGTTLEWCFGKCKSETTIDDVELLKEGEYFGSAQGIYNQVNIIRLAISKGFSIEDDETIKGELNVSNNQEYLMLEDMAILDFEARFNYDTVQYAIDYLQFFCPDGFCFDYSEQGGVGVWKIEEEEIEVDLFDNPDALPEELKALFEKHSDWLEENSYESCAKLLAEVEKLGYTFEYGLDACPYNLHKKETDEKV